MEVRELLVIVQACSTDVFAELKNGEVYRLPNGEKIPPDLIHRNHWQKADGFYKLSECCCSGKDSGCFIGRPNIECKGRTPEECGTYSLHPFEIDKCSFLSYTEVMKIIEKSKTGTRKE